MNTAHSAAQLVERATEQTFSGEKCTAIVRLAADLQHIKQHVNIPANVALLWVHWWCAVCSWIIHNLGYFVLLFLSFLWLCCLLCPNCNIKSTLHYFKCGILMFCISPVKINHSIEIGLCHLKKNIFYWKITFKDLIFLPYRNST